MVQSLLHELETAGSREHRARQNFVSNLRGFLLNDTAAAMQQDYAQRIEPVAAEAGNAPATGEEVHAAIQSSGTFRFYSSMRYNAQEMVWRSVMQPLDAEADDLNARIETVLTRQNEVGGSLTLNDDVTLPKNVADLDVHLAPGSYHNAEAQADWLGGAVYDHGLNVFSFGAMGRNLDDIGHSFAQWIRHRHPDFAPTNIVDLGTTIGHNACAWKQTYPDATVTAIDVAPACLRYGHARALSQGIAIDFVQMDATQLDLPDDSQDVVFSSMFLHELSVDDIKAVLSEAYRVLKPGGLMLHMELPPNEALSPYDAFYLDWDAYYNNEPYYKTFRDQDFTALRIEAGFPEANLFHLITPQYTYMDPADFADAVKEEIGFSDKTGRLTDGIQWYGFGAWK